MVAQHRIEVRLDVVFDTVCPWCYIGKRRLTAAATLRPHIALKIRWNPFFLNPDMPFEGMDRQTYLSRKFGGSDRALRIYDSINRSGSAVGIPFAFDRILTTPNSLDSHRLIRFAARQGDPDPVIESIFRAYFVEGRNIGDRACLALIAAENGLSQEEAVSYLDSSEDADDILAENARSHRIGITGVPAYIIGDSYVVSGAQEPQVLARVLDVAAVQSPENLSSLEHER